MFQFLLNIIRGFYNLFLSIDFKGMPVLWWGFSAFVVACVVRFLLPLFHISASDFVTPVARKAGRNATTVEVKSEKRYRNSTGQKNSSSF